MTEDRAGTNEIDDGRSTKFEVGLDGNRGILIVRLHGVCTYQDHCNARDLAAKQAQEELIRRILVDVSDSVFPQISTIEEFAFAQSLAEKFRFGSRIAIVERGASESSHSFARTVAWNRGVAVTTFGEESKALAWLCEE